jgi:hypothetical protein
MVEELFSADSLIVCSNSVQPVRLYPILMSILLYHYKELAQCVKRVEEIEARISGKNKEFTKEKEEDMELLPPSPSPSPLRLRQLKLSEF